MSLFLFTKITFMKIVFLILGIPLFLAGAVWLSLFLLRKRRILERFADCRLADCKSDEIVPAETTAKLFSDGFRMLLLHLGGASLLLIVGIHLIVFYFTL